MRYTFLFGLCFFIFQTILAQSPEKALRETLRKKNLPDTVKVKALLDLGSYLSAGDSVMPALKYMQKALELAEKSNLPKLLAISHLVLGNLEKNLGNHTEALKNLHSALNGFQKLKMYKQYIHTQQLIGKVHEIQGNYDRALQYYQESREIAEKQKFIAQLSFTYNNIGNAYFYKQEFKKAVEWQLKGIDLRKKTDSSSIQYSYNDIANIYLSMGKQDSALYYLQKSRYVAEKQGDLQLLALGATNIASMLDSVGRHKEAVEIAEKSLPIAQKIRSKDAISAISRYLGTAYAQDGALQKSIAMYELHINYRDSLQTEQAANEIAKLETNHEIERHAKEAQQIKAEKQQQQYWLMAALVGLVLLLGVAVMLVRLNTYRRKTNIILQTKNNEIQEANLELQEKNEEINQQKEEITIIAETLEQTNRELNQKNEDITASITYASRIQQAILPTLEQIKMGFTDTFVIFHPRDLVSGDFYFFNKVGENHILAVADCTGHGVPGALMSMIGNELLTEIVGEKRITEPALILADLHKGIRKALKQHETDNRDGMDIAIINHNPSTQNLQFAGAKNPLTYIENDEIKTIKGNSFGIGGEQRETERVFTNHILPTAQISWVYMFSDGFQDQFGGENNKKFGLSRLRETLLALRHETPQNQQTALLSTFQNWRMEAGEKQIDDVLIVGVKL